MTAKTITEADLHAALAKHYERRSMGQPHPFSERWVAEMWFDLPAEAARTADRPSLREVAEDALALAGLLNDNAKRRGVIPYYTEIADKALPKLRAALHQALEGEDRG